MGKMRYTATGIVWMPGAKQKLSTWGRDYEELTRNMAKETATARYTTNGVNGDFNTTETEPYTLDLLWPRVEWEITRNG